ncbi:MAG: hypothetical protein ACOYM8_18380 [Caulobacterales bacterium]|jgi:hypothetical protein
MLQRPPDASHTRLIELQVDRLEYLFDPFDPFPTPTRDLSRGAEDFIVGWARELPQNAAIGLRLHLRDEEASTIDVAALKGAISRHFTYKADRVNGDKKELLAIGRVALMIGICVLGVCMVARQIVLGVMPGSSISGVVGEGLVIVGWVANWRPIEIFLYEWWPMSRRRRLYERLAIAELEIVPPQGIAVGPAG